MSKQQVILIARILSRSYPKLADYQTHAEYRAAILCWHETRETMAHELNKELGDKFNRIDFIGYSMPE